MYTLPIEHYVSESTFRNGLSDWISMPPPCVHSHFYLELSTLDDPKCMLTCLNRANDVITKSVFELEVQQGVIY